MIPAESTKSFWMKNDFKIMIYVMVDNLIGYGELLGCNYMDA